MGSQRSRTESFLQEPNSARVACVFPRHSLLPHCYRSRCTVPCSGGPAECLCSSQCYLRDFLSLSGVRLSAQVGAPLSLGAGGDTTGSSRCSGVRQRV